MEKKRILIVDDEEAFTRMMKLVLEQTGLYNVGQESKGTQALATAREFKPDLILLDVVMPGLDGGDLAAEIQAEPQCRGIPFVFLTAVLTKDEAGQEGVVRGGMHFLAKPVKLHELVKCIEERLSG